MIKRKDPSQFPKEGFFIRSNRIIVGKCCGCGLRHAWYFEVIRNKKGLDEVYIQCEVINDKKLPK